MTQDTHTTTPQTHAFQAEMQQLLGIIIHSLYSEREVFLRELISNAADALNKIRFLSQTQGDLRDRDAELAISLSVNAEANTLTIEDTGVGMTHQELKDNLGTIARSGTLNFVRGLSQADPALRQELIGQFGVGFYAAFMVAQRVTVDSCPAAADEAAWQWVSEGSGTYTMAPSQRKQRGTTITLELREDAKEFSTSARLEEIVRRYSNFIAYPIRLDGRRLNTLDAVWTRAKDEVKPEQYEAFYQFLTHGFDKPRQTLHFSIDAPVQYRALLFVPSHMTNEMLYSQDYSGLKLYANKVFIQDNCRELLPLYLRFLRGVVDSEDIPLNVSREMVQQGPVVAKIKASLTGRVLRELKTLADSDAAAYNTLWAEYGKVIKEGIPTDPANRERLVELLRFSSTKTEENEGVSLKGYLERMKPEQKEILYATGPNRQTILRNPSLEYFQKHDLEVLLLDDQVDDFVMTALMTYEGKALANIEQADLEALKPESGQEAEPSTQAQALTPLLERMKTLLGSQVKDVTASRRLVDSPAVLTSPDGMSANMAKMMRTMGGLDMPAVRVLEVNPDHPLVQAMLKLAQQNEAPLLEDLTRQLLDNCLLTEGGLEHPETMVERLHRMMERLAQTVGKSR